MMGRANGKKADKQFRPFTYCRDRSGSHEWRVQDHLPVPRPLDGLDQLAARADARCWLSRATKKVARVRHVPHTSH